MAEDYGLLMGLAEGLKSGMSSYRDETDRQQRLQEKIEERKRQKQRDEMDAFQHGLIRNEQGLLQEDAANPNVIRKQAELEAKKLERENATFDRKAGLLGKGVSVGPDGNPVLSPEAQAEKAADLAYKKAQTAYLLSGKGRAGSGKGGGGGRPLTSGSVENLAGSRSAMTALDDAKSLAEANPEMFGKSAGLLGDAAIWLGVGKTGTKAASIESDLMTKAQTIGRYLEGGKLAEGDAKRYEKMLPARGDKPEIVQNKIATLKRLVEQKLANDKGAYSSAGYDVSGFEDVPISEGLIKGVGKTQGPSPGQEEDGYIFLGGDKADPKNWKKKS